MSEQPFIGGEERPELDTPLSNITVRQLMELLGQGGGSGGGEAASREMRQPKLKDVTDGKGLKEELDQGRMKDLKDHKDQKEPKDHKDSKDMKEQIERPKGFDALGAGEARGMTAPTELEQLVQRVAALEREVEELKQGGSGEK